MSMHLQAGVAVGVDPAPNPGYDAVAYVWARQSLLDGGFEARLFAAFKSWLAGSWPFRNVAFPGREIPWETWYGEAE